MGTVEHFPALQNNMIETVYGYIVYKFEPTSAICIAHLQPLDLLLLSVIFKSYMF